MATGKISAPASALTPVAFTLTHNAGTPSRTSSYLYGKAVYIDVMSATKSWSQNDVVFTVPTAYRPAIAQHPTAMFNGTAAACTLGTDGKLILNQPTSIGSSRCYINFSYLLT